MVILASSNARPWKETKALFSSKKFSPQNVTSNLTAHAWSTKCRRKTKLIAQLGEKSRDETFEPN